MRILRLGNINKDYRIFEKYVLDNLYVWDKLPAKIRNNERMWTMFLENNPQFYNMAPKGQTEVSRKEFEEVWKGFLVRNPNLFSSCPLTYLKDDKDLREDIYNYWQELLLDRPYEWNRVPSYLQSFPGFWGHILEKRPQYAKFVPQSLPEESDPHLLR